MSTQAIRFLIAGVLLLHGLGHVGSLVAMLFYYQGTKTGPWDSSRTWLVPSLSAPAARMVAGVFWALALVGFVAAALSFWGIPLPVGYTWRQLALIAAIISSTGMLLFIGTWPCFNTLAAFGVNLAVLYTQLWSGWPPLNMFGK